MMIVSAIAAMGVNRVIGVGNQLPWHLPLEFRHFKHKTLGHTLITGRKSFESIGHPLEGRHTIIVSRNSHYRQVNCELAQSFASALLKAQSRGEQEVFITGGGEIYQLSLPYLHRFYRTVVDFDQSGDVYFPAYEHYDWKVVETYAMPAGEQNPLAWRYQLLEKVPESSLSELV